MGGANEIQAVTHAGAVLLLLTFWVEVDMCLVFSAPCLSSPSTLSYVPFSTLTQVEGLWRQGVKNTRYAYVCVTQRR